MRKFREIWRKKTKKRTFSATPEKHLAITARPRGERTHNFTKWPAIRKTVANNSVNVTNHTVQEITYFGRKLQAKTLDSNTVNV